MLDHIAALGDEELPGADAASLLVSVLGSGLSGSPSHFGVAAY